ncbi:MAG: PAS domain S-box protein [bacterium]
MKKLIGRLISLNFSKENNEHDTPPPMKEVEPYFKSMFENANEGVLLIDPAEKKICNANALFCHTMGYSEEEIKNASITMLHPKEKLPYILNEFERLARGEVKVIPDVIVNKKEGGEVHFDINGTLINFSGKIYCIAIYRDATERKKKDISQNISEEKYRSFLQNFQGIAFCRRIDGTPLFIHGAVEKITGYTEEEFNDDTLKWEQIIHHDDRTLLEESTEKLKTVLGYFIGREYRIIREDGEIRWIHEIIQNICDDHNEPFMIQGTLYDITLQILGEEELREASFKVMEKDMLKAEFLLKMSQAIRIPMNTIIGFSDLLLGEQLADDSRDYVHAIRDNGNLLVSIVDSIADLTKLETGHIEIEHVPFSLTSLFTAIYATAHTNKLLAGKNISLRQKIIENISEFIIGDCARIQQVINGLINNAIKFTEEGLIEYGVSLYDEKTLEFYVMDTGRGIPENMQDKIFEPFTQCASDIKEKSNGIGLGLSIIRALIELMGGRISVESHMGEKHGSIFYFYLPYRPTKGEITGDTSEKEISIQGDKKDYTILVSEHNSINHGLAQTILKKSGYTVVPVSDGREAVSAYKSMSHVDLIIIDIQMSVCAGLEAIRVMRDIEVQGGYDAKIPIIALIDTSMTDYKEKCMSVGCNDWVAKPINKSELLTKIEMHLGTSKAREFK